MLNSTTAISGLYSDISALEPWNNMVVHEHGCGCAPCATGFRVNTEEIAVNAELGVIVENAFGDVAPIIKLLPEALVLGDMANDSIPGDSSTTETISSGNIRIGELDAPGDTDWFEITLTAGTNYIIEMDGFGGAGVPDTLVRLYDSGSNLVGENDDSGGSFNSKLEFTPTTSGTYYIEAAAFADAYMGDYSISVSETPTSGVLPTASLQGTIGTFGANPSVEITYGFQGVGSLSNYGGILGTSSQAAWRNEEAWSQAERDIVRGAFDEIEAVLNVTFREVSNIADAEMDFIKNNDSGSLGTAGTYFLSGGGREGTVRMNHTILGRWEFGQEIGGQGHETLVHEIGHLLGLGHTHDTGFGSGSLIGMQGQSAFSGGVLGFNDPVNSIMAYRDGWAAEGTSQLGYGNRGVFGAWDMAALINLYGINPNANNGNNVYVLPDTVGAGTYFTTIVDAGGTDEITTGSSNLDAVIDLRPATLDADVETSGGAVSHLINGSSVIPGGITIEATSQVENATGGGGDDDITGNDVANTLVGNGGDDKIAGLAGADMIFGGAGADSLLGGDGADSIVGGTENDTLQGGIGFDTLEGGAGTDLLQGGGGSDVLEGGEGGDIVDGGGASDQVSYAGSGARVEVNLSANTTSGGDATGDTLVSIEGIIGSAFNDLLVGNSGINAINGGDGVDNINGGAGADDLMGEGGEDLMSGGAGSDMMDGGADADRMFGNGANDTIDGGAGNDTIFAGVGFDEVAGGDNDDEISGQGNDDEISGGMGDDLLRGGSADDTLRGDEGNDTLFGNGNDDRLEGGDGEDRLQGASGADSLFGGADNDTLTGGNGNDQLSGDAGDDLLNGGAGSDEFTFAVGFDEDRINGYEQGTDSLLLDIVLWNGANLTEQQVINTYGSMNGNGTILTLDFGGGDILEVQAAGGINMATLGTDVQIIQ